ncbi:MAG: hypothetical protein K2J62_09805, partial [Bacteroidales bacterium]|nr:hypothetical protein [Bacteroidales bacterium]
MIKRYTVLMSALLLAFSSCSDRDAVRLMDDVESHIHADPVRALSELECVDRSRLRSRSATARFSLLYTMALDKTEQMPDNDSTIGPALDYYRRHGSIDDRIKSLYYLGRSQYEAHAYSKAIVTFTKAYALLEKSMDDRYCGLVNQAIADTYMTTYNDNEVMPYLDAAYDCFVRYGDKSLSDLTLYKMAIQCTALHQYEKADSLFRLVIEEDNVPDSVMPNIISNYAVALITASSSDSQRIEDLFSRALDLSGGAFERTNFWAAYAYILAVNGKKDLSESIFRQLQGYANDGSSVEFWESRAYAATHDYKSAYHSLKRSLYVQDSIISVKLQNSSAKAQRDYFSLQ